MATIIDLSFPGQRTATATSCIPHDSVYMPGPLAGKSENGFFRCDTRLQIFQNDSKICEAEVTVTPLIKKICKPWTPINLCGQKPLASCQSTESLKKSTPLLNANTSFSTLCCDRPLFSKGIKKTFSWQHFDVPGTTVHWIG